MSSPEPRSRGTHPRQGPLRSAHPLSLLIPIVVTPYPDCRSLLTRSLNSCSVDLRKKEAEKRGNDLADEGRPGLACLLVEAA